MKIKLDKNLPDDVTGAYASRLCYLCSPQIKEESMPHLRKLPNHWAVLIGRFPTPDLGFKSDRMQIVYNNSTEPHRDDHAHAHSSSDEVYIVLEGAMILKIDDEEIRVEAGEFLCVGAGTPHQVVETITPLKSLVVRSPSVEDKLPSLAPGLLHHYT